MSRKSVSPIRRNQTRHSNVQYINQPKIKHFKDITREETYEKLDELNKIWGLNNDHFRALHHMTGSERQNETVQTYLKYLKKYKSFDKTKNTYFVALRIHHIHMLMYSSPRPSLRNSIDAAITTHVLPIDRHDKGLC